MSESTVKIATIYRGTIAQLQAVNETNRNLAITSGAIKSLSPRRICHDYCTVRIGAGRQTGKTSAVIDIAGKDDLVVVINKNLEATFREQFIFLKGEDFARNYLSIDTIWSIKKQLKNPDPVPDTPLRTYSRFIVDNASHIFSILDVDDFYEWAMAHSAVPYPQFVFLG